MAAPSPSLSLSDIMHPLSPPPTATQPKSSSPPLRARSVTPEPLELAEIEDMRRKILAMGCEDSLKGKEKIGTKEQQLVDMLLRLTHPASLPQPSQLHAQAETISHLIQQRDFLVKRSTEERERWESDKEGWARAAQALIVQGRREAAQADKDEAVAAQYALVTADASTQRMQEFERANTVLQNDKKALQQKLVDTQKRLALLESELAQLKPLLLMQPYALTHSHPTGTARGWSAVLPSASNVAITKRKKDSRALDMELEAEDEPESDNDALTQPLSQSHQPSRNPSLRSAHEGQPLAPQSPGSPFKPKGDYYRSREPLTPSMYYPPGQYNKSGRRKAGQPVAGKPMLSDARAEHLLLAARKIGRQRASILSGAFAHTLQPEPPSHYKQKGTPTSQAKPQPQPPRTPRRNANANTPLLTRTPLGQPSGQQPRTPLQSLLSAAQSVLSAPGSTSPSANESPVAKRRRLDPSVVMGEDVDASPVSRKERGKDKDKPQALVPSGIARVRSALDFLADQAEVYSTQPSQTSADSGGSPPKDLDDTLTQDIEMDVPGDSTSVLKGKGKASTPAPRSRASTPVASDGISQPAQPNQTRTSGETTPTTRVQRQPDDLRNSSPTSVPIVPITLAPPIDLTPRTSRSPVPQSQVDQQNPRKRSRSHSTERNGTTAPVVDNPSTNLPLQGQQEVTGAEEGQAADADSGAAGSLRSRAVEDVKLAADTPPRRTRSPYIKWTKEEDELLAKAVAKYGQKWDLVQKALPSRGYHQVRQRWLRKLGVFDGNKLDLASLETNAAAEFLNLSTTPPMNDINVCPASEPRSTPNPKLGLAPLNSERVLAGSSGSTMVQEYENMM